MKNSKQYILNQLAKYTKEYDRLQKQPRPISFSLDSEKNVVIFRYQTIINSGFIKYVLDDEQVNSVKVAKWPEGVKRVTNIFVCVVDMYEEWRNGRLSFKEIDDFMKLVSINRSKTINAKTPNALSGVENHYILKDSYGVEKHAIVNISEFRRLKRLDTSNNTKDNKI